MKKFWLYIKSGTDYPDYEEWIDAKSKREAVELLFQRLRNYGYSRKMLEPNVIEESEIHT